VLRSIVQRIAGHRLARRGLVALNLRMATRIGALLVRNVASNVVLVVVDLSGTFVESGLGLGMAGS